MRVLVDIRGYYKIMRIST